VTAQLHIEEVETGKPRTRSIKIEVPEERLREELKPIARAVGKKIRIPGFRPGRAPYALIERRVGRTYLLEEYLNQRVGAIIDEVLKTLELRPNYPVEITNVSLEPVTIEVDVPLEPRVEPGDYHSLRIEYSEPEVSEEDVDAVLEDVLKEHSTLEPVDEPVQEDDNVESIVTIRVGDQTPVDHETITLQPGESVYLPGLSEQAVGMKAGETRESTLDILEEHPWREHGEEAHVTLEVLAVKRLRRPELTLELAKELNPDVESVEELRNIIRENLEVKRKAEARAEYEERVIEAVDKMSTVEYPPVLVERELDAYMDMLKTRVKELGLGFDEYLQLVHKTEEQIREENRAEAEQTVRKNLLLEKIRQDENLQPEEGDFSEILYDIGTTYNIPPEQVLKQFEEDETFARAVYRDAVRHRTVRYLAAIARGEEAEKKAEPETKAESEAETVSEEVSVQSEEMPAVAPSVEKDSPQTTQDEDDVIPEGTDEGAQNVVEE